MLPLPIRVASKRCSLSKLLHAHPDAQVLDVTSRGDEPWVRFSPFYPHGDIPVPGFPGMVGASVEGIWQGLKVFERAGIDQNCFANRSMKGIKRSARRFGKVLGHRAGPNDESLLDYLVARHQIYLPCYRWMLDHCMPRLCQLLRERARVRSVILLDYNTNGEVGDLARPLSHAQLIILYLADKWPQANS